METLTFYSRQEFAEYAYEALALLISDGYPLDVIAQQSNLMNDIHEELKNLGPDEYAVIDEDSMNVTIMRD